MNRNRVNKGRAKRQTSVEEHLAVHATDEDQPQVTIDIEQAWEEWRRLVEVKDAPPPEPVSTAESDAYIRSFFIKEDER
jgi:hypothetical protein